MIYVQFRVYGSGKPKIGPGIRHPPEPELELVCKPFQYKFSFSQHPTPRHACNICLKGCSEAYFFFQVASYLEDPGSWVVCMVSGTGSDFQTRPALDFFLSWRKHRNLRKWRSRYWTGQQVPSKNLKISWHWDKREERFSQKNLKSWKPKTLVMTHKSFWMVSSWYVETVNKGNLERVIIKNYHCINRYLHAKI